MDRVALGQLIRQLREARGWTLRDLAERAQLSHAFIGAIEVARPAANPTVRALTEIFDALEVQADIRIVPASPDVADLLPDDGVRRAQLLRALSALAALPDDELELEADMLGRRAARAAGLRAVSDG